MKSPFELRTELLELAQNHLEKQYFANLEFSKEMLKLYSKDLLTAEEFGKTNLVFPTTQDILEKAKEFYQFVNFGK